MSQAYLVPGNQDYHIKNHVVILLDASTSMEGREADVIKAADNQIKYLARRSEELKQETRVSVYVFASFDSIRCVIFDMDVLRLPSIAGLYKVYGNTALIDATHLAIGDLKQTMVKYGDHAFLVFVFTDGEENDSRGSEQRNTVWVDRKKLAAELKVKIDSLPDNWTLAALVPDTRGKNHAISYGFPEGNVSVWDVDSLTGVEEAMTELQTATDSYMVARASGQTGTRKLFSTDASAVNAATIKAAGLKPLADDTYVLLPVEQPTEKKGAVQNKDNKWVWEIRTYVLHSGAPWSLGSVYYLLDKKERIGGQKKLAVLEAKTGKVYVGDTVRALIGLPEGDKTVAPDFNPDYKIYVQSTSNNRHLKKGDHLLVLK